MKNTDKFNLAIMKEMGIDKSPSNIAQFRDDKGNWLTAEAYNKAQNVGSGFNQPILDKDQKIMGSATILIESKFLLPGAYFDYKKMVYGNSTSSYGETIAHELIGHALASIHGLNGDVNKPDHGLPNDESAIRAGNLYRIVTGNSLYLRDGSHHNFHDPTKPKPIPLMNRESATTIPSYLKSR